MTKAVFHLKSRNKISYDLLLTRLLTVHRYEKDHLNFQSNTVPFIIINYIIQLNYYNKI